jgi:hypothetical protein
VYAVLYHKYTTAKKKKFFDGFVILKPQQHQALLMSQEGKQVSQKRTTTATLAVDTLFSFGNWDAEARATCFRRR